MSVAKKVSKGRKSNNEGSVTQRKDGTWTARMQVGKNINGTPKIKAFYGKTETEVKKKLNAFKKQLLVSGVDTTKKKTVAEYFNNWLVVFKYKSLKAPSYDRLESIVNSHIIPDLGYYQMGNLSSETIQTMLNLKAEKYSYSTVKKIYIALNDCLNHAVKKDDIIKSPMNVVTMPLYENFNVKNKEMVIFTDDEIQRFVTEATRKYSNGNYVYPNGLALVFALNTGVRIGELLGLETDAFDLAKKTIVVKQNLAIVIDRSENAKRRKKIVLQNSTKTRSGTRIVPLNTTALHMHSLLMEIYSKHRDGVNYFLVSKNKTPIRYGNILNTFDCILRKSGIAHCGLHNLRHTFASKLFERGVDVKTVSEILGHASVKITYDTYIHIIQSQKTTAVDRLNDLFINTSSLLSV